MLLVCHRYRPYTYIPYIHTYIYSRVHFPSPTPYPINPQTPSQYVHTERLNKCIMPPKHAESEARHWVVMLIECVGTFSSLLGSLGELDAVWPFVMVLLWWLVSVAVIFVFVFSSSDCVLSYFMSLFSLLYILSTQPRIFSQSDIWRDSITYYFKDVLLFFCEC